jgi:hypothetical protein
MEKKQKGHHGLSVESSTSYVAESGNMDGAKQTIFFD